jgi:hypothetical protein
MSRRCELVGTVADRNPQAFPESHMKPIFRLAQPARLLAALLVSASLHSGLAQAQQDGAGDEAAKPIYPSRS